MQNSIKKIFDNNIDLIRCSDKSVSYLRMQNFNKGLMFFKLTIDIIMDTIQDIFNKKKYFNEVFEIVNIQFMNQILIGLQNAQENKDYMLLSDLLELQLIPFLLSLQEIIISKEVFEFDEVNYEKNIELIMNKDITLGNALQQAQSPMLLLDQGYCVEYTSSGLKTLALYENGKKYYLHSNSKVFHEAGVLAKEWLSDEKSEYMIYGLGLGYHALELMELDDSIVIYIYESDLNVIQLACAFSNIENLLNSERVHLIYDPFFEQLNASVRTVKEDKALVIHYPSLRNIKNEVIREQMEDYFLLYSSVSNQLHKLKSNFKRNILHYDDYVDSLKKQFFNKDLYIVAAGPSLDKNFMKLKSVGKNAIILATGTVLKKLLSAGIRPDYVIIIDANAMVYTQIEEIEKSDIPLLFLSTVYYKIPQNYQGKKYLICQEGFSKAEEYANRKGYKLYQTGGSVSTTSLDVGISFQCKRIIYLGLDLAYTDQYDHASGTADVNRTASIDLRQVMDIDGNMVGTSKNLDIYRKWIEKRIKNVKGIEFIDATEGGAKIEGMQIKKLAMCI